MFPAKGLAVIVWHVNEKLAATNKDHLFLIFVCALSFTRSEVTSIRDSMMFFYAKIFYDSIGSLFK